MALVDVAVGVGLVGQDDGFVFLRRESEPVKTNPGDVCCGDRVRSS